MGLTAEEQGNFAFEHSKHLFEIVAMRRRAGAWRNEHIDQAVTAAGLLAAQEDTVYTARLRNGRHPGRCGVGYCKLPIWVVWWNWREARRAVDHDEFLFMM
jgi:hypothetical protein